MERRKIVAGNWKQNLSLEEGKRLSMSVVSGLIQKGISKTEVILFPSFLHLTTVNDVVKETAVKLGAQNVSNKEDGAFTGEVSAFMLSSARIKYVLIGHSERRDLYSETGAIVSEKLKIALKYGLKPVLCCGESYSIRMENLQERFIETQLELAFEVLTENDLNDLIIAYEPVWAIGTGLTASPEQAQEMHQFIRKIVFEKFGQDIAQNIPILYGGSCRPENALEIFKCPDVDGGLVGGASLTANEFISIVQCAEQVAKGITMPE